MRQAGVGVIGLGHMGRSLAANFLSGGFEILVYDHNPAAVDAIVSTGAYRAGAISEFSQTPYVLTSLPDDVALEAVAFGKNGLIETLKPGGIHISMSTVSPQLSRRLQDAHRAAGQGFVAAPVLGNPDLAAKRSLFILVAGHKPDLEKARPLLAPLADRIFELGENAADASLMKLAGNVMTAITLESMGEVLALLRKSGVDRHVAFDVLTNSLFDSKVHRAYGGKIVDERYSPAGMAVPLAVKDLRLALAEAEREAVPMPAASLVHDRLVALMARGWASLDWSALGLLAARDAGLCASANSTDAAAHSP